MNDRVSRLRQSGDLVTNALGGLSIARVGKHARDGGAYRLRRRAQGSSTSATPSA